MADLYEGLKKNPYVRQSSIDLLRRYTRIFENVMVSNGIPFRKSNEHQDSKEHIDYFFKLNGKELSVDLKSNKNLLDKDFGNPDYDWIWVELKNVRGEAGSLHGKADLIGIVFPDKVLLVGRKALLEMFERKCTNRTAPSRDEAFYSFYTRAGRKDVISKVSLTDVQKECKTATLKLRGPNDILEGKEKP